MKRLKVVYLISFLVVFNILNPYLLSGIFFGGRPFYWGGWLLLIVLLLKKEKLSFDRSFFLILSLAISLFISMIFNFREINFFVYGLIFVFSNVITVIFIRKDFFHQSIILKVCKISISLYFVSFILVNILPEFILISLRNILINDYYSDISLIKRSLLSSEPSTAAISLLIICVLIQLYEDNKKEKWFWVFIIFILLIYIGSIIGVLILMFLILGLIKGRLKLGFFSLSFFLTIGWFILGYLSDIIVSLGFDPSDGSRFVFISMSNFFQNYGLSTFPQSFDTRILSKSMDYFISNIVEDTSGLSYIFYEFLNFTSLKPLSVAVFIQLYFGKIFWFSYLLIISFIIIGKNKLNARHFFFIIPILLICLMIQYPILFPIYAVFNPSQK